MSSGVNGGRSPLVCIGWRPSCFPCPMICEAGRSGLRHCMETVMTLREILMVHPKGVEYGGILGGHDQLPVLRDAKGQVLSFPPIINSREIGEVQIGDDQLFVEVTGTDLPMVKR